MIIILMIVINKNNTGSGDEVSVYPLLWSLWPEDRGHQACLIYIYIHMYTYICVYIHIYIYIYICIVHY